MKLSKARSGPFRERLHYTNEEIEHLAEDELAKHHLLPPIPGPIDIDRYVEQRFSTPEYEALRPTLLGYTEFGPDGPTRIVLNQDLASDTAAVAKRRVRTTLAHEAGHALLHTILYHNTEQSSLLPADEREEQPRVLCKDNAISTYHGEWWEYQANMAMSSLLLPQNLTLTALSPYLTRQQLGALLEPHNEHRAIRAIADTFDVNPVVAEIRINALRKRHVL